MRLLFALVFLAFAVPAAAQPWFIRQIESPNPDLQISNPPRVVELADREPVYAVPFSRSGADSGIIVVTRLDKDHDEEKWTRTLGFSGATTLTGLVRLADGTLLLEVAVGAGAGARIVVSKLNESTGASIWTRAITGATALARNAPLPLSDGVLVYGLDVVAGRHFVQKLDFDGDVVWGQSLSGLVQLGDAWHDPLNLDIYLDAVGGTGPDARHVLLRFDDQGSLLSSRRFSGALNNASAAAVNLALEGAPQGQLYLADWWIDSSAMPVQPVLRVMRVDTAGTPAWVNTYRHTSTLVPTDLLATPAGELVVGATDFASQQKPAYLFRLFPNGNQRWGRAYALPGSSLMPVGSGRNGAIVSTGLRYDTMSMRLRGMVVRTDSAGGIPCCPLVDTLPLTRLPATVTASAFAVTLAPFNRLTPATPGAASAMLRRIDSCSVIVPDTATIVPDSAVCLGERIHPQIDNPQPGYTYEWTFQDGSPATGTGPMPPAVGYEKAGMYLVELTISIGDCPLPPIPKNVFVAAGVDAPNAFTPNGDEYNNTFRPLLACPVDAYRFTVFSRWGQRVFETTNPQEGWDGAVNGNPAPSDVYVWKLEYTVELESGPKEMTEAGEVTVLR